jgi:uncharacterized protein with PQ loop repeat
VNSQLFPVIAILTTVISVLVKLVGLPDQIRKNHTRKSTSGLSVPFFVLGLVSYAMWTFYGALKQDWVLIIGQGIGMVTMGVIAWQIYLYRNSR